MKVNVRFAPSPTGALHIGGVRTALYNYLFAKKHGGEFLLRIEDTDQTRYVAGAEDYIIEALRWLGITPDKGVGFSPEGKGADSYRQSDRKQIYMEHAHQLVKRGHAYFAFDTPEALDQLRQTVDNFTYNHTTRLDLENSLTLSPAEVTDRLEQGVPYVIRLKVEPGETVVIEDLIRGTVSVSTSELDDKVLLKADGMPTYHLANIIDDHLMEITHVIRGEEWLPSTAHHVLLYRGFGWESTMPTFSHLPLILKPEGSGKLSKRDGAKFGMPVFPLSWVGETPEESFPGFREAGFLPEAVLNFLALLGWHPSDDQELFSLEALVENFDLGQVSKSGARFNFEKAKWFNQQYIHLADNNRLLELVRPLVAKAGYTVCDAYVEQVIGLMKDRAVVLPDFVEGGYYFYEGVRDYDWETVAKKWNPSVEEAVQAVQLFLQGQQIFTGPELEAAVKNFISEKGYKMGDVLPMLRLALAGTMKGPAVFEMASVLGKEETVSRIQKAIAAFNVGKPA